ncbi:unnamed protein product [Trypanosoma congolense IL3000]|uniref:WGS project CAEQ00000000 data, annotated contig 1025 n=1 Tax=Trypanosoma congolense (strain IL3000) TaxID=1068625 RepID=F9W3A1_TRYCI|nr:unnamed protein product [Trypanosoma congolense IL3000]
MEANAETDIQEQLRTRAALLEAEEEAGRIHMERLQLEEQFELVQPIHDFEKEVRALRSRKETRTASTQSEEEYPEIQTEQTTKQTASAPDTRDVERAPARAEIQESNENIAKRPNRPSTVTRIFESLGGWRQCVLKVCVLLIVFLLVRRFAYRLR